MLSPDFNYYPGGCNGSQEDANGFAFEQSGGNPYLAKLFEDPQEKAREIQSRIEMSRMNKKRKRINSGTSNQS